ncbi:hypothetical protein [Actinosynnema mirum]|uniref:Uncharacterized protein n=1 Tax=Actinosynnema mirum (strain ATCC 29888 / DSM 43827 / JCM 3225 / NBRC 14064 / NCIMB 13271 / NRRL B-12336 / IMRU 3971 / 101) TaxID=446462 RepID=C6WNV2_ACTMD|nr:hypothetical protein [Actinosynnema mirum]ACU36621.1 hypothetical protein Amir_2686 [Actinosynnema mirum DSM 43827]
MKINTKLAVTAVVAALAAGAFWSLLDEVREHEAPLDPAALIEATEVTGFRRVAVTDRNLPADLVSYAIFVGPRTPTAPEVRVADRDDTFTAGATVPEEWRGALEAVSNARLRADCRADVLRFLPGHPSDDQLRSWQVEVSDVRRGRTDVVHVRIACGRERH